MEYKEFCKMMEQKLPEYLPQGLPALIRPGTEGGEDYLEVRAPGSDFSTKIWLEALYTMFQCGISENEILMRSAEQAALVLRSKEDWTLDWQQAKKKILPAAVAYRSDALQDVPHRRIEDIAVVVKMEIMDGSAAATVTEKLMAHWGVTKDDLFDTAAKNGMFQYPLEVKTLGGAIEQLMEDTGRRPDIDIITGDEPGVYIAGAPNRFGAGVIAYRDFWEKCRNTVKSDFWLLPASIYEWLIIKDDGIRGGRELQGILKCCNQAALEPREFLGDKVYHYSLTGEILESSENWMRRKANAKL